MKTVALSGWGQPHDALNTVLADAQHYDYTRYGDVVSALSSLRGVAQGADVLAGWSLGAQLAVRAVASGIVKPKKLVLIAPPFQFVEKPALQLGMKHDLHTKFYENYKVNALRTLRKAWELVIKGDKREDTVREYISKQDITGMLEKNWGYWLEVLERFSCDGISMADFPPTLLIHGKEDVVIDAQQSAYFAQQIPYHKLVLMEDCGHAPHWHNSDMVAGYIQEYIHA